MAERPGRPAAAAAAAALLVVLLASAAACQRAPRTPEEEAARAERLARELLPAMERLSGLAARAPVRVAVQGREEVRAFVEGQLARELEPAELEADRRAYVLLGLLPDTLDLRALLLELYTEQVVGYYDPESERLYVARGAEGAALRQVVAHELVHALQDQHVDVDSLLAPDRGSDRVLAAQAALEGQATIAMVALGMEEQSGRPVDPASLPDLSAQIAGASTGQFPVFAGAPRILRETLIYPYAAGAGFIHELWRREPGAAPFGPLLPQSTEQVSHAAERFFDARDEPTQVELEDPAAEGWAVEGSGQLGQFEIAVLLQARLGAGADSAALGWDGDAWRLLASPDGRALVWVSVWDDEAAADRFARAYRASREAPGAGAGPAAGAAPATRGADVARIDLGGRPGVVVIEADPGVAVDRVPRALPRVP